MYLHAEGVSSRLLCCVLCKEVLLPSDIHSDGGTFVNNNNNNNNNTNFNNNNNNDNNNSIYL